MTDETRDESDNWEQKRKEWDERLASGAPMFQVLIDVPFKVFRGEAGVLSIDTATFGLAGFDRLGVVRIHVTPAAENSLKILFDNLEKIPDGLIGGKGSPTAN
jgi:hypothetical protein